MWSFSKQSSRMREIKADFTIPTPNVYKKWNELYENLNDAGFSPWRAKPAFANHYQMWFETEREDALEKITELIPYKGKRVFYVEAMPPRKEQDEVV